MKFKKNSSSLPMHIAVIMDPAQLLPELLLEPDFQARRMRGEMKVYKD